jgi:hypothetical protein
MREIIPKRRAWLTILFSILIVSGTFLSLRSYYSHMRNKQLNDPKFRLVAIAQASGDGELLKTSYLAELFQLSVDRPVSLIRFDSRAATSKLQSNPLMKSAHVSKIKPGTLLVEYQLRAPIAFLGDYSNTALDSEGVLFPFHPFFTPKKLPEILLGDLESDPQSLWGQKLKGFRMELAFKIYQHLMQLFNTESVAIRRIDVSKAYSLSYGQRQIVILLEERFTREHEGRSVLVTAPRTLRLGSVNWIRGLSRYLVLRQFLAKEEAKGPFPDISLVSKAPLIIDLRVPRQALFY